MANAATLLTPLANGPVTAAGRLRAWREDPVRFVHECFHAEPDAWQAEVLAAFPAERRIAMVACKGPGKSTVLSWLIWNFLATRPHPKIAATAITGATLHDTLWTECAKWQKRSPFLEAAFEWSHNRIAAREHPETWWASARTWSRDADPEQQGNTLAGIRADFALYILDEAGGIPDAVAQKAEAGLLSGIETRMVISGNPTHLSGPLYRAATTERKYWRVFEVTGDPDDPKRAPRVSIEEARKLIERYGRNDSLVQVDVFGHFPSGSTDALVSRQQFEDAFTRWESGADLASTPRTLGLDVARFGTDRSVLCFREGDLVLGFDEWRGQDTEYTSSRTMEQAESWARDFCADGKSPDTEAHEIPILVDDIGVGGGVTDKLMARGFNVTGVNVGSAPCDRVKFANLRAELNLAVQDRFREGGIALAPAVKSDTTLMAEGTTLRVGYAAGTSKRKIESKDEYKKRVGRSPDYWDALVLAFHPGAGVPLVMF